MYGPHIAQLYASTRVHEQIHSLGHFFKGTDTLDLKLNLASANYELTYSIPHVVDYFGPNASHTWDQIAAHEEELQAILLGYLNANDRVTIYGEPSANRDLRVPVISFTAEGMKSQQLVEEVEARSPYGFRSGHMYSHRLLTDVFGLDDVDDGIVRVSLLHYNTSELPLLVYPAYADDCRGGNERPGQGSTGGNGFGMIAVVAVYTSGRPYVTYYSQRYPEQLHIPTSTAQRNASHKKHAHQNQLNIIQSNRIVDRAERAHVVQATPNDIHPYFPVCS